MAFCVAGKLRKVDKALLRDATTEMKVMEGNNEHSEPFLIMDKGQ